jgi:hypothetical protein
VSVRIALHSVGDVGRRAGLILLAERGLTALGLYGHNGPKGGDRKTIVIRHLDGFDPLVTDDAATAGGLAAIAADDGISCVVTADAVDSDIAARFTERTLLLGANLSGVAESLAAHEVARTDQVTGSTAAWTTRGKALRRGAAVAFPEPVGARWGREASAAGRVEVPLDGEWAAASATITGEVDGDPVQRVVGVADLADHLGGIALAAGAIVVAEGSIPPGVHRPGDHPEAFLAAALRVGLEVASYTEG